MPLPTSRLHTLIWVLIYGGLLLGIWTLFVEPANAAQSAVVWGLRAGAALTVTTGVVLIGVRARRPG